MPACNIFLIELFNGKLLNKYLYSLLLFSVLNPDNSYEMFVDQSSVSRGSLLTDVVPPVNPPKETDDPKDSKPEDWDERAKIPDPEAVKPEDWWDLWISQNAKNVLGHFLIACVFLFVYLPKLLA